MAARRHSTIQFNPTEWLADTARMPRLVRSVLFDLCCYTWERVAAVPPSEVYLMTSDLPDGQGEAIIENLIQGGHLERLPDGSIFSGKAMIEAQRAYTVWEAKSRGGRGRGRAELEEPEKAPSAPQDAPEPAARPDVAPLGAQEIVNGWNAMAAKHGYKQVVKMTPERHRRLVERIAEHGAEAIIAAIETMPERRKEDEAKQTFDALLKPDTCTEQVRAACGETAGQLAGEGEG